MKQVSADNGLLAIPLGASLLAVLALPDVRQFYEAALVSHMLVQLPLLALAGWLMGKGLMTMVPESRSTSWNRGGITGLIIAIITLLFWMLPKSLDAALGDTGTEVAKFVMLPLCLGLPLALSWPRAHVLIRGLLKAQFISMLGVLSFLYTHAPVRICNNYLVGEQETAGLLMGGAAIALAAYWGSILVFGPIHLNTFKQLQLVDWNREVRTHG